MELRVSFQRLRVPDYERSQFAPTQKPTPLIELQHIKDLESRAS